MQASLNTDEAAAHQAPMLLRMDNTLAAFGHQPLLSYPVQMWRYALDCARGEVAPVAGGEINALPYVPDPVVGLLPAASPLAVLDVGCLGGYGLFDFARRHQVVPLDLAGIDIDRASIELAHSMGEVWASDDGLNSVARLAFHEAPSTSLPLPDNSCHLVIARLMLPYVDVPATLREFHRVATAGAILLVQTHAPGYYLRQLVRHVRQPLRLAYYSRPILSGLIFRLTGRQPRHRRWQEVAIGNRHMVNVAMHAGFPVVWTDTETHRGRPRFAFRKDMST